MSGGSSGDDKGALVLTGGEAGGSLALDRRTLGVRLRVLLLVETVRDLVRSPLLTRAREALRFRWAAGSFFVRMGCLAKIPGNDPDLTLIDTLGRGVEGSLADELGRRATGSL